MRQHRRALATLAAVTALLAACSSGGGKQSTPTTVSRLTMTTLAAPVGYESGGPGAALPHLVASLGPCPKGYGDVSLVNANAGIPGLDKNLVPIPAAVVRICEYLVNGRPGFIASGVLTRSAAQQLAKETNRLPKNPGEPSCPPPGPTGYAEYSVFVLTFASDAQHVVVFAFGGCGSNATNGMFTAEPSPKWLNELLQRYTPCPALTTGPGAPPGPTGPFCPSPDGAPS
jgi:hypothetical protein